MKTNNKVYSSKNIIILSSMFIGILLLLYVIGVHLQEQKKIEDEILAIQIENKRSEQEILEKKRQLEYLNSPQRKYKEAKMQLGKKLPNERSITFIEKSINILPSNEFVKELPRPEKKVEPFTNWQWVFLR